MTNNEDIKELDVLGLRRALVDLYTIEELFAKVDYELELLEEYMTTNEDYEQYGSWKERVNEAKSKCKNQNDKDNDKKIEEERKEGCKILRAELKSLRERVAWYDRTWAEGSVILAGVSFWASSTMFTMLLIGLLPIIHSSGQKELGLLQWGALGFAGGLLSILVYLKNEDTAEVGETIGKQVIQRTLLSVAIGTMTAILLYAALSGGLIEGKLFPDLSENTAQNKIICNGLSIFWGIFAGFSLGIFTSLRGLAENALGKDNSN